MKIEYRIPSGSGSYSTLADEANSTGLADQISRYEASLRKVIQTEPLAFATAQFVADRGNVLWTLKFTVDRVHASPDAALSFVATHAALFGAIGTLDLQITVGATVLHSLACAITELTPQPRSDQTTVFSYGFTGASYG